MSGLVRAPVLAAVLLLALVPVVTAQAPDRTARLGLLSSGLADGESIFLRAFLEELSRHGWDEGRNLAVERRYAEGRFDRLPGLAAELLASRIDVLVAAGAPAVQAARKAAGATLPIVMTNVADPVGLGIVTSLARPGGNITGLSDFNTGLVAKRVQLLGEIAPSARRIAVLMNPTNPTHAPQVTLSRAAAARLGLTLLTFAAARAEDIERAFAEMKAQRADAFVLIGDPFFRAEMKRILALAARQRLPANYSTREWSESGGLSSYGTDFADLYRRAAGYVDRILRGAKPADLPIEQPTTLELVVNLRAARDLGLTVPASILARADRVLE
jgi:ABC-type uncharacterized transport system substrate-binding protein